jgi:hypothetical protein
MGTSAVKLLGFCIEYPGTHRLFLLLPLLRTTCRGTQARVRAHTYFVMAFIYASTPTRSQSITAKAIQSVARGRHWRSGCSTLMNACSGQGRRRAPGRTGEDHGVPLPPHTCPGGSWGAKQGRFPLYAIPHVRHLRLLREPTEEGAYMQAPGLRGGLPPSASYSHVSSGYGNMGSLTGEKRVSFRGASPGHGSS